MVGSIYTYIHKLFQFSNINVHKFCKEKDLEACVVKLYLPCCTIGIVNIYRSPSGSFEHFLNNLETLLNPISSNSMELIICGIFNINFLNNTVHKQLLSSLLATYGLYSKVSFPTRICSNSVSTIDNIFINIVKYNNFIVYPLVNSMSDHDAQIIVLHDITIPNDNNYFHFTRTLNKSSVLNFNFKLTYEFWDNVFSYNVVNLSFNNSLNTYLRIFYSSFPIKKIHHISHTKAWLTQGIKISCINKRKIFLISRNSNDREIKNHYKKYCKVLEDVIKLAKKIHYNNLLVNSSNKTKNMWSIINENINEKPQRNNIPFININGTITHNSQVIANTLNTFKQLIPSTKLKFVSPKEIEHVVSSLKMKESHGSDGISTKILKQSIPYILSTLTYIRNLMISTGIFPTRMKFAEIKPLYKKGEMANISNYRPISLLTSFSKIFENIIFTRLTRHLNYNHILVEEQFGFRTKSSTDLASCKLINDILKSLNNKLLVGGVFCDLQKAFDCVDHDLLLSKMLLYGISGKGYNLIHSYLKNRYQRVITATKSRQYYSEWEPIRYGVPQGSILVPCFLCCI